MCYDISIIQLTLVPSVCFLIRLFYSLFTKRHLSFSKALWTQCVGGIIPNERRAFNSSNHLQSCLEVWKAFQIEAGGTSIWGYQWPIVLAIYSLAKLQAAVDNLKRPLQLSDFVQHRHHAAKSLSKMSRTLQTLCGIRNQLHLPNQTDRLVIQLQISRRSR